MSKKKGLSVEEKIEKVDRWFETHPEPYTLKELQSLIPKATGVIYQSIEECVEVLVSENRLNQEKVGVQTLIWKFPQTEAQKQRVLTAKDQTAKGVQNTASRLSLLSLASLQERRKVLEEALNQLQNAIDQRQSEIGSMEEYALDMQAIQSLARQRVSLQTELHRFEAFDPVFLEKLQHSTAIALEAANRWTENLYLLEDYIGNRMGRSSKELRASLGIPVEIDYVDDGDISRADSPAKSGKAKECSSVLLCPASTLPHTPAKGKSDLISTTEGVNARDDSGKRKLTAAEGAENGEFISQKCDPNACEKTSNTPETVSAASETNERAKDDKKEAEAVEVRSSTQSTDEDTAQSLGKESHASDSPPRCGANASLSTTNAAKKEPNPKSKKNGPANPPKGRAPAASCSSHVKRTAVDSKGKKTENKSTPPKEGGKENKGVKSPLKGNSCKRANSNRVSEGNHRKKVQRV